MVHECEWVNAKCRHRTVILTEIFNKRECECERENVALGHRRFPEASVADKTVFSEHDFLQ